MNSNNLFDLNMQQATVSTGYKLSESDEIAIQQKVNIVEQTLGEFQIGYHKKFNDNLESKIKVDQNGLLSAFARYHWSRDLKVGASVQTSLHSGSNFNGFMNQPVNFGLRVTHNS